MHFRGSNKVEILNISSKQWSEIALLPFQTLWPSVSICGQYVYVSSNSEDNCVQRWSLFSSAFATVLSRKKFKWEGIAPLPVKCSTLVTVKGHLLAVGGKSPDGDRTTQISLYNSSSNSWQVISQMNKARSHCVAAFLPSNKLMVVGGTAFNNEPIEEATIKLRCLQCGHFLAGDSTPHNI